MTKIVGLLGFDTEVSSKQGTPLKTQNVCGRA